MGNQPFQDLAKKVVQHLIYKQRRGGRYYDVTKLIDRLLKRHDLSTDDRVGLMTLKIGELRLNDRSDEAFDAIVGYLAITPMQPEPWIMLVTYYRDDAEDMEKAVLASAVAVAIARLDGNFVRQALGERMRALLTAERIADANECLRRLLAYEPAAESIDIERENDFLRYPNAASLDHDLTARYRALLAQ